MNTKGIEMKKMAYKRSMVDRLRYHINTTGIWSSPSITYRRYLHIYRLNRTLVDIQTFNGCLIRDFFNLDLEKSYWKLNDRSTY